MLTLTLTLTLALTLTLTLGNEALYSSLSWEERLRQATEAHTLALDTHPSPRHST